MTTRTIVNEMKLMKLRKFKLIFALLTQMPSKKEKKNSSKTFLFEINQTKRPKDLQTDFIENKWDCFSRLWCWPFWHHQKLCQQRQTEEQKKIVWLLLQPAKCKLEEIFFCAQFKVLQLVFGHFLRIFYVMSLSEKKKLGINIQFPALLPCTLSVLIFFSFKKSLS